MDLGSQWHKQNQNARASHTDPNTLDDQLMTLKARFQTNFRKKLEEDLAKGSSSPLPTMVAELRSGIARVNTGNYKDYMLTMRKELIEGFVFVDDQRAAHLDLASLTNVIELRSALVGLLESLFWLFENAKRLLDKEDDDEELRLILDTMETGINIGRLMKELEEQCVFYLDRSRFAAVKEHLF